MSAAAPDDVCVKCGRSKTGELKNLRLGADEAPVLVKCECDDGRLQDAMARAAQISESVGIVHRNSIASRPPTAGIVIGKDQYTARRKEWEFRLDDVLSRRLYTFISGDARLETEVTTSCAVKSDGGLKDARLRWRSYEPCTAKAQVSRREMCPGVTYHESTEYEISELVSRDLESRTLSFLSSRSRVLVKTQRVQSWIVTSRKYLADSRFSGELEFLDAAEQPTTLGRAAALEWIHTFLGHRESMRFIISPKLYTIVSSRPTQVIDILHPPSDRMVFRVKADGVPRWLVRVGSMMYICKRDADMTVVSWRVVMEGRSSGVSIAYAEEMSNGALIPIDIVVRQDNEYKFQSYDSPQDAIEKAKDPFAYDIEFGAFSNLIMREMYTSRADAEQARKDCNYATDGVVGIDIGAGLTYRFKQPTVDLLASRGTMRAMGKMKSITLPASDGQMHDGRVYECEIAVSSSDSKQLVVTSWHPRPDKVKPNKPEVVRSVISRLKGQEAVDEIALSQVTSLCFSIRELVYESAARKNVYGKAIIDIGSGRLQSLSLMVRSSSSFMLCDPELNMARLPRGMHHLDCTGYDGKSMISAMRRLNSGDLKFASFRGTCESLLKIPGVMDYVISSSIPLAYSFSVSHVADTFRAMAQRGAAQVACGYVYDKAFRNMTKDVFRIGKSYVALSPESRTTGVYAFAGDKPRTEAAIRTTDFPSPCEVSYAIQSLDKISKAPAGVRDVLANVAIITS